MDEWERKLDVRKWSLQLLKAAIAGGSVFSVEWEKFVRFSSAASADFGIYAEKCTCLSDGGNVERVARSVMCTIKM